MSENETMFADDASIDARLQSQSQPRPRPHSGDRAGGKDNLPTVLGEEETNSEDSPLLGSSAGSGSDPYGESGPRRSVASAWPGDGDFEGLPWWRRPSVFWMLPPFLIFSLSFGGSVVPKINLILTLICRQYLADRSLHEPGFTALPVILGGDNPQCQENAEVQALVSRFTLYGHLLGGLLAAFSAPRLGKLSDRYGRTRIFALTATGMLVAEFITIIVASFPDQISVYWILLGFLTDGLFGSFTGGLALAHSYATDCSPPGKRAVVFGYFHGCLFTGVALGPIAAGYIVKATGQLITIFYIAVGGHLLFALFACFVIPESLSKKRQLENRARHRLQKQQQSDRRLSTVESIKEASPLAPLSILRPTGEGSSAAVRRNLFVLATVDTIMFGVAMGAATVMVIYSEYMFGWGNFETSIFISIVNTSRVCMLVILLPTITRLVRGSASRIPLGNTGADMLDIVIIRIAVLFDLLGLIGFCFARTGPVFILCGMVASFGGMGSPTLQSALTKHIPPHQTGQLLGAMGLLHALARVVAPTFFNLIYSFTVGKFSQAVFVCLAATFVVAFVFTYFLKAHVYVEDPAGEPSEPLSATVDEEVGRL